MYNMVIEFISLLLKMVAFLFLKGMKCALLSSNRIIVVTMEQRPLENVNSCLNTNISSYLETSGANAIKLFCP